MTSSFRKSDQRIMVKFMKISTIVIALILLSCQHVTAFTTCEDIDPLACKAMFTQNAHICEDSILSGTACPKFCNKCPLVCYNCNSSSDLNNCNLNTCAEGEVCVTLSDPTGAQKFTLQCADKSVCGTVGWVKCCSEPLCNDPSLLTTATTTSKATTPEITTNTTTPITTTWTSTFRTTSVSAMPTTNKTAAATSRTPATDTRTPASTSSHKTSPITAMSTANTTSSPVTRTDLSTSTLTTSPVTTMSTTSMKTTMKTSTMNPTTPAKRACHRDIILVVDESPGMSSHWTHVKEFVKDLIDNVTIDQGNEARLSFTTFTTMAHTRWQLNSYITASGLKRAVTDVHRNGNHMADNLVGVMYVNNHALSKSQGNRRDASDVVIFISEGHLHVANPLIASQTELREVTALHQHFHNVIAIGIGTTVDTHQMSHIATGRSHKFFTHTGSDLKNIENKVFQLICE